MAIDTAIDDQTARIQSLMSGRSLSDPKIYEAILTLATQVGEITRVLEPVAAIVMAPKVPSADLLPPTNLRYQILHQSIRLEWTRPAKGATFTFEVRQGAVWDIAFFITRTPSTIVDLVPIPGGGQTYLVKSVDPTGAYSVGTASITLTNIIPGTVALTGAVIDNNVLLRWSDSLSLLDIDYYEVMRGTQIVGNVKGNFAAFFETSAGQYLYTVTPVDVVGTRGAGATISLLVNQPPDFVLTSSIVSDFRGTKSSVLVGA